MSRPGIDEELREQVVDEAREQYADAPVRDFVPNLVERDARDRLKESQ